MTIKLLHDKLIGANILNLALARNLNDIRICTAKHCNIIEQYCRHACSDSKKYTSECFLVLRFPIDVHCTFSIHIRKIRIMRIFLYYSIAIA